MKVKMKIDTHLNGRPLNKGDTMDVDKDVAERWQEKGIAEAIGKKPVTLSVASQYETKDEV